MRTCYSLIIFSHLIHFAVLHIDASLDWMQVSGGKVLWRPGDPSDSFYIVVNGRLRAIDDEEEGNVKILGEYGQGDPVRLETLVILTTLNDNTSRLGSWT